VRAAVFVALTLSGTLLATACAKSNPQASELTSAATSAPDPPSSPLPMGNIAEGRAVFALNCATCHGATGVEGGVGPSLRDERERKNYDATIAWIKNPLPPMPKLYPSLLTESAVDDVAAYIQSL
jgi:mono/diheme cytochrome c family protein